MCTSITVPSQRIIIPSSNSTNVNGADIQASSFSIIISSRNGLEQIAFLFQGSFFKSYNRVIT